LFKKVIIGFKTQSIKVFDCKDGSGSGVSLCKWVDLPNARKIEEDKSFSRAKIAKILEVQPTTMCRYLKKGNLNL
jgi:hypothetical protein